MPLARRLTHGSLALSEPPRTRSWAAFRPSGKVLYGRKPRAGHKYAYVGNRPTSAVDPSGLEPHDGLYPIRQVGPNSYTNRLDAANDPAFWVFDPRLPRLPIKEPPWPKLPKRPNLDVGSGRLCDPSRKPKPWPGIPEDNTDRPPYVPPAVAPSYGKGNTSGRIAADLAAYSFPIVIVELIVALFNPPLGLTLVLGTLGVEAIESAWYGQKPAPTPQQLPTPTKPQPGRL